MAEAPWRVGAMSAVERKQANEYLETKGDHAGSRNLPGVPQDGILTWRNSPAVRRVEGRQGGLRVPKGCPSRQSKITIQNAMDSEMPPLSA
jgi:hypothetical protein